MAYRRTSSANQRRVKGTTSYHPLTHFLGWAGFLVLTFFHLPGGVLLLVCYLIGRLMARPPELSGKDAWKNPVPAVKKEHAYRSFQRAKAFLAISVGLPPEDPRVWKRAKDANLWLYLMVRLRSTMAYRKVKAFLLGCLGYFTNPLLVVFLGVALFAATPMGNTACYTMQAMGTFAWLVGWDCMRSTITYGDQVSRPHIAYGRGIVSTLLSILLPTAAGVILFLYGMYWWFSLTLTLAVVGLLLAWKPCLNAWRSRKTMSWTYRMLVGWLGKMDKPVVHKPTTVEFAVLHSDKSIYATLVAPAGASEWLDVKAAKVWDDYTLMDGYQVCFEPVPSDTGKVRLLALPKDKPPVLDEKQVKRWLELEVWQNCEAWYDHPHVVVKGFRKVSTQSSSDMAFVFTLTGSVPVEALCETWMGDPDNLFGSHVGFHILADYSHTFFWLLMGEDVEFDDKLVMRFRVKGVLTSNTDTKQYLELMERAQDEANMWANALAKSKLPSPEPDHDTEKVLEGVGYRVHTTTMYTSQGSSLADYMRVNLRPSFADATIADIIPVGRMSNRVGMFVLSSASQGDGRAPSSYIDVHGNSPAADLLRTVYVSRALTSLFKNPPFVAQGDELTRDRGVNAYKVQLPDGISFPQAYNSTDALASSLGASKVTWDFTDQSAPKLVVIDSERESTWVSAQSYEEHMVLTLAEAMRTNGIVTSLGLPPNVGRIRRETRQGDVWSTVLTLNGGLTVAALRKKDAQLKAALGIKTLYWEYRDAAHATMWANTGDSLPDDIEWLDPVRSESFKRMLLTDAWGKVGIIDKEGNTPTLIDNHPLDKNPKASLAQFTIPVGFSPASIIGVQPKYEVATNLNYTRILTSDAANEFRMVMSEGDPLPFPALASFDELTQVPNDHTFLFAIDDMGERIAWNPAEKTALLLAGGSGSGKSTTAQILTAAPLLLGHQLIVLDPAKGAVDFAGWAQPYCLAFAGKDPETDTPMLRETTAILKWVEEEMGRRAALARSYHVGKIDDLPDDVRPPRLIVFFDEFNSYMGYYMIIQKSSYSTSAEDQANAEQALVNQSVITSLTSLNRVATQGRSWGVHLIFGGQSFDSKLMAQRHAPDVKKQAGKLLLGANNPASVFEQVLVSPANRLQRQLMKDGGMPKGRGIYSTGEELPEGVQSLYAGGQDKLIEALRDVPPADSIDYSPYMPASAVRYGDADQSIEDAMFGDDMDDMLTDDTDDDTSQRFTCGFTD